MQSVARPTASPCVFINTSSLASSLVRLHAGHLCPTFALGDLWRPGGDHYCGQLSAGHSFDRGPRDELRQAERSAWHLAGEPLPLADPHFLVDAFLDPSGDWDFSSTHAGDDWIFNGSRRAVCPWNLGALPRAAWVDDAEGSAAHALGVPKISRASLG